MAPSPRDEASSSAATCSAASSKQQMLDCSTPIDSAAAAASTDTNSSCSDGEGEEEQPTRRQIVPLRLRVDDAAKEQGGATEKLLEFECDWTPGIGGSVWTSGELLAAYLELQQAQYGEIFRGKTVVELGSGTGFVGLMTAACFEPKNVYLTDLHVHLEGLRRNAQRNAAVVQPTVQVHVAELTWGCTEQETRLLESLDGIGQAGEPPQVDVILGTDVAYLRELHEALLLSLDRLATRRTLVLLGLNRVDTDLDFFRELERLGFEYYKVPDVRLPEEYWGRDFGLFEIRRRADWTPRA